MIWTLKIKLLFGIYANESWEGTLEIDSSSSFEMLHEAIQNAVEFGNDHLYEFYIANTDRSRERILVFKYSYEYEEEEEEEEMDIETIEEIFPLENKKKLFYIFDYGDNWLFQISKSRKKPFPQQVGIKYPRLILEKGKKPKQYPDYDE